MNASNMGTVNAVSPWDGAGRLCGKPDLLQQCLQVVLEIAVVRHSRFSLEIEADLNVLVGRLQPACKPRKRPQPSDGMDLVGLQRTEAQQCLPKPRRKDGRQRPPLRRFNADREIWKIIAFR